MSLLSHLKIRELGHREGRILRGIICYGNLIILLLFRQIIMHSLSHIRFQDSELTLILGLTLIFSTKKMNEIIVKYVPIVVRHFKPQD